MSGRAGAPPLLEHYKRAHDQFVALAAAAAVTTTLKLGSGICLVAQHDHVWLAKQVASIDVISGGRFTFGVGYGWNHEEMESHGLNPRDRRKILREKVLACKEIWTKEVAEGALFATLWLPALDRDEALAAMDSYAELVDAFNR